MTTHKSLFIAQLMLISAVFTVDCRTPANFHVPLLYIPALFVCRHPNRTWALALTTSVLSVVGAEFGGAPWPTENWIATVFNRASGILCIFAVAFALERINRAEDERDKVEKYLKWALRARETFLATLSHELRNPLVPLVNGIGILRSSRSSENDALLVIMERQIVQLVRLVDDLLDLSKMRDGRMLLKKEAIALSEVVRVAIESCKGSIDGVSQRLSVEIDLDNPRIECDAMRVTQAITNLIDNASKFTPNGGKIDVAVRRMNDRITISVRDTGCGIASEALLRVFDLFTREEVSIETRGLGIGLALVKEVAELHGGSVEARSDGRGKGAEFILDLPVGLSSSK